MGMIRPTRTKEKDARTMSPGTTMENQDEWILTPWKKKFTGKCFNCGKSNHLAKDCKSPKQGRNDFRKALESSKVNTMTKQPDHGSMSWTACYNDNCLTHKSDKEGIGWYLRGPKTLAMVRQMSTRGINQMIDGIPVRTTTRSPTMDIPDRQPEPPVYKPETVDLRIMTIQPAQAARATRRSLRKEAPSKMW